jgi:hypothetical protein
VTLDTVYVNVRPSRPSVGAIIESTSGGSAEAEVDKNSTKTETKIAVTTLDE